MLSSAELAIEISEKTERINELRDLDERTDDQTNELDKLTRRVRSAHVEQRAALVVDLEKVETREHETHDSEHQERLELRSKARLGRYISAAMSGRVPDGVEAELAAAEGVPPGTIPLSLWQPTERRSERETRAITPAPGTVGVNVDPFLPAVFAQSIAPRLGIDMPMADSGSYATGTITTSQNASAKAKGAAQTANAGAITVATTTPKRVSAVLELAIEDIAAVGQANFESILRENLSFALTDQLDEYVINGDRPASPSGDQVAIPNGLFKGIGAAPTAPTAIGVWADYVDAIADAVDGLWAMDEGQVNLIVGPATYSLSAKTFREPVVSEQGGGNGRAAATPGDKSAAAYLRDMAGMYWTSSRMPDAASTIQQAILWRAGRSGMGASQGMRTAVCPVWQYLTIDDIYSGATAGKRAVTMHALVGDVIVTQSSAYKRASFKVA